MNKILFLLLILITNANADCTPKDLTDPDYLRSIGKENLVDHFQSPRNQDSVGWCAAFASSDSLSFEVGEPVSAIDLSIKYFASSGQAVNGVKLDNLNAVTTKAASDIAKTSGYCPESVIPSNQTSTSNLGQSAIVILLATFQQIYDDYAAKGKPIDFCLDCLDSYEKIIKPSLPLVTTELMMNILQKNQNDSLTTFKDLLNKLCDGRRVRVNTDAEVIMKNQLQRKTVANVLDEALDGNSMPAFVMNSSNFANSESIPGGHGLHAMIVVARRMGSDGKCEYLVRNSWGKGCSFYLPHIAEKCDAAKGSFWMDQNQLQAGVDYLTIIKNKKTILPIMNDSEINSVNNKVSKEKKFSLFNIFKKKSRNNNTQNDSTQINEIQTTDLTKTDSSVVTSDDTGSNSKSGTINIADDVLIKSKDAALKVQNSVSKFFSAIWNSLAKAFKYKH